MPLSSALCETPAVSAACGYSGARSRRATVCLASMKETWFVASAIGQECGYERGAYTQRGTGRSIGSNRPR